MTRLEQIEFKDVETFKAAIDKVLAGEEVFRSYTDKEGKVQRKKIINNHRLYLGGNLSLNVRAADNGTVYCSVDFFSVQDRIELAKKKNLNVEHVDATEL